MTTLHLPTSDGALAPYTMRAPQAWPVPAQKPQWNRVAFAAAHVVADPRAAIDPWVGTAIDWDTTLAFRHHLWSLGFGVAEAMDTAQRGMGLDWPTSLELIRRSVAESRTVARRRGVRRRRHRSPSALARRRRSTTSWPRTRCSARPWKRPAAASS